MIFGALVDDSIEDDSITITVLATVFGLERGALPVPGGMGGFGHAGTTEVVP